MLVADLALIQSQHRPRQLAEMPPHPKPLTRGMLGEPALLTQVLTQREAVQGSALIKLAGDGAEPEFEAVDAAAKDGQFV